MPVVIALNMADLLEKREIKIDTERLSMVLGCPIIETSALKGDGLNKLMEEAIRTANTKEVELPADIFSADLEKAIENVKQQLPASITEDKKRWYAVKLLENDSKVSESMSLGTAARSVVEDARKALESKHDNDMESIVTDERYQFIQKVVKTTVKKAKGKLTVSDRIDQIVTNRILGIPIFIAVMFIVYYISVSTVGTFVTDWTNDVFVVAIQDAVSGFLKSLGASEMILSLVVDGIVGGLGASIGLRTADGHPLPVPFDFGRLRLYGAYRLRHGPCVPPFRPFGKELHPAADLIGLRHSGASWHPGPSSKTMTAG